VVIDMVMDAVMDAVIAASRGPLADRAQ